MTDVYLTDGEGLYEKLVLLSRSAIASVEQIKKTAYGKPYVEGCPLHFSLSHSGSRGVIAVGDRPVGVDLELYTGKDRGALLSRLTERERSEIDCERDFLKNWTAKEAFVKMLGGSIAVYFKRLEFYGGEIYLDGEKQDCGLSFIPVSYGVVALCGDGTFNARSL